MTMLCINVGLMVVILSFIDRRNGRILFCLRMPQLPHLGAGCEQLIERDIELKGALAENQRSRLLEIANRCPVHRTLTSAIDIRTTVK